ncbi:MAG: trypsin-like peptidase domain-containing protein [Verrucomicrobia bacterium]|nr:trypsin-like peptidase domain-containing protein [Verrucomicrobiota bacterium]
MTQKVERTRLVYWPVLAWTLWMLFVSPTGGGPGRVVHALGAAAGTPDEADIRRDAVVRAIEEVMPSVVNISTETIVEIRDPFDQIFRDFFGPQWGRRSQRSQNSLGSGVIIDETGYVLTNLHVVRRANVITVTLADGRTFEAKPIVGTLKTDVALLRLITRGGEKFKAIKFAPDDDLLLGETVLALGNPFGLGGSVSRGILSSKARRPVAEDDSLDVQDWLQSDAAINPGNSGGPLVNLRGELIGINVAIFREAQGIGFAIPIKRVSEALGEIYTPETVRSLWFGANFQSGPNGLVAVSVETGSPADRSGLKTGDRVLAVGDRKPRHVVEFNRELLGVGDRREIRIVVERNQERKTLTVRLTPLESVFNANLLRQRLGAAVQVLTPELAARMGFGQFRGLMVTDIEPGGPAEKAALREGELIQAIEGRAAENVVETARWLYRKNKGEKIRLSVIVPRAARSYVQLFSATKTVTLR